MVKQRKRDLKMDEKLRERIHILEGFEIVFNALDEAIRDGRVAASIAAGILAVVPGIRDREGCGAIQAGEVRRHSVRTSGRQVERDPRRVGPVRQSGRAVPAVAEQ